MLPGLGWVAVTGSGECEIRVTLPEAACASTREPLLTDAARTRETSAKFTGGALTDKRGGTKRTQRRKKR